MTIVWPGSNSLFPENCPLFRLTPQLTFLMWLVNTKHVIVATGFRFNLWLKTSFLSVSVSLNGRDFENTISPGIGVQFANAFHLHPYPEKALQATPMISASFWCFLTSFHIFPYYSSFKAKIKQASIPFKEVQLLLCFLLQI